LLGDTPDRDYSSKLRSFEEFAASELRQIIKSLLFGRDARVLDLGCGTGFITDMLARRASSVVGLDLSTAHAALAAGTAPRSAIVVGDTAHLPFAAETFDVVWSSNTINHLADPVAACHELGGVVRQGGWLILGQSSLLPEMYFAWDYHLDARVRAACHAYYREKHGLADADTAASTRLLGVAHDAGLEVARVHTHVIERTSPLNSLDRQYFLEAFQSYWGSKLRPFLDEDDWQQLDEACNPLSPGVCVDRPDFHHIQTYTVVEGRVSGR
jgi:SAM-dependent methyltransferase